MSTRNRHVIIDIRPHVPNTRRMKDYKLSEKCVCVFLHPDNNEASSKNSKKKKKGQKSRKATIVIARSDHKFECISQDVELSEQTVPTNANHLELKYLETASTSQTRMHIFWSSWYMDIKLNIFLLYDLMHFCIYLYIYFCVFLFTNHESFLSWYILFKFIWIIGSFFFKSNHVES